MCVASVGSHQMKKKTHKLTLSKIDFLSSVIIIGLDNFEPVSGSPGFAMYYIKCLVLTQLF